MINECLIYFVANNFNVILSFQRIPLSRLFFNSVLPFCFLYTQNCHRVIMLNITFNKDIYKKLSLMIFYRKLALLKG